VYAFLNCKGGPVVVWGEMAIAYQNLTRYVSAKLLMEISLMEIRANVID
jgi:hypothetical protein